jgi:hypothetical protein
MKINEFFLKQENCTIYIMLEYSTYCHLVIVHALNNFFSLLFFPNFLNLEVMILYYNMMEMKYAQLHFTARVMVELGKCTKSFTK